MQLLLVRHALRYAANPDRAPIPTFPKLVSSRRTGCRTL